MPEEIARLIAHIIYLADCEARKQISGNYVDHNERSYFGAIVGIAAAWLRPLIESLNIETFRFDVRDTHTYDGVFIFRVGNFVKIGICEAKLLRFINDDGLAVPLTREWDSEDAGESHFCTQIERFDNWSTDCATWIMLMNNLEENEHHPPLDQSGSSCLWHSEIKDHIENSVIDSDHIWTFQDVLDIEEDKIISLEKIVYDILICNKGNRIPVTADSRYVNISYGNNERRINIPFPRRDTNSQAVSNRNEIQDFLTQNKLSSYNYFHLKDFNVILE